VSEKMIFIQVDLAGTVEGFQRILNQTISQKDVVGILIFGCDANEFKPETVNTILKNVSIPVFGGIFPEIIHRSQDIALIAFQFTVCPTLLHRISGRQQHKRNSKKTKPG